MFSSSVSRVSHFLVLCLSTIFMSLIPPSLSHYIAIPEWIWKGQYVAICTLLISPYRTLSCPHTSHLCTITYVLANTYLNSHNTCHVPFLQVSWHLFLQLVCPLLSASCSSSVLPLPFERMSHLTSNLSLLASVLCPIEIHGQAAHMSPALCSTPHRNTSFKCTWFFFSETRPVSQCSPL